MTKLVLDIHFVPILAICYVSPHIS